jgi:[acyl-carrier-protein] S-malonyltransferase
MQKAVPQGEGAMAAILGLEFDQVKAVVEEASTVGVCAIANDNSPGQIVISGTTAAVNKASESAKAKGAKRALLLPVSAPFHCPLMKPAALAMADALQKVNINMPALPIIANVTAAPVQDVETIRKLLVEQVTGMVRWRESVQAMAKEGVTSILEVGVGKVLSGLIKRIVGNIATSCVASVEDIKSFNINS